LYIIEAKIESKEEVPMMLTSSAFKEGERIPSKYTCDGADCNPPLHIEGIPSNTKSLALIVDDPDAPVGTWVHWVVFGIPIVTDISEKSLPGKQGRNDFGRNNWGGPCPPSGTHRYFFKLYALDNALGLPEGSAKAALEKAMQGHILAKAELVGLYSRSR
jgi:Raf kinase inhibitor-like YbhB/YbcL family protein